jgi:hypothetical protein
MEFSFEALVTLTLEHKPGNTTSKHVSTEYNLEVSENLERNKYLDDDGVPTEAGTKALSSVLVQGLVGNIHMAHDCGYRDSAEHLRWIIAELEKGFASVAQVTKSNFK